MDIYIYTYTSFIEFNECEFEQMPFCAVNLKFWLLLAQGASTDGTRKHVEKIRNMMTATIDTSTKSLYWKSLSQISQNEFKITWRMKIFLANVFFKTQGKGQYVSSR